MPNNAKLQPITTDEEFEIKDSVLIAYVGAGGDVTVPNGVTEIGVDAFYNNKTIGRVTLPEGVTTVSYSAFRRSSVTEIALPSTLETIGNHAFYQCASLMTLETPDALTSIGEYAFQECKALETIEFGTGLTEIGQCAFYDCDSLTAVTLPDGVASLEYRAFAYSNALTSFTFGTGFATFYDSDGYGAYPLESCSALKEVTFTGMTPPDGPYYSGFRNISSLETVYVPSESYEAYVEAFRNCVPSGTVFATNDYYNISVSGLHAEQTFGRSVVLTWNPHASAAITQYQIRYGETVLTTEETQIRIGGLEPDTAYTFTVTGLDTQGKTTKAATTTASTVTPVITALAEAQNREMLLPGVYTFFVTVQNDGNLAAPFDGGNALGGMLRWEDAQGNILKTVNLSADVETMGRFAAELDLSDTGSGIYTLRAAVTDPDGVSAELTKTISVDASTPTVVRNFHAAGDLTEITLTWSTAVEASVTGYRIYRSPASEAAFTVLATVNGRNTLIYHDTSAAENQEYAYYIVALGSLGQEGTACETVTAARIADTEKPQVTRISPANNSRINGTVTFHATAIDNVAVASVAYEYSLNEGNTWVGFNGTLDTTVLRDGSLYVRATATDRSGNVSDPLRYAYMMDNTGPEQVTGLYGESTSVTITLHWNDVADDDIRFYRVERLENGSYRTELDSYMTLGANLYGLTPDTEYTFRVVGYDTLGNRGIPSDPVTVRTGSDETAPVITRILPSPGYYSSSIPVSVTAEDDYCVRTITVQTSRNGADWTDCITETYSDVSRVQTASVDLDLSTLDEGVLYVRGICADAAGNVSTTGEDAPYTQYMIDKTAPAAPSGVTATGGCGYIEIAWEQGSEHDLGTYSIYRAPYANASYSLLASGLSTLNYVDRTVAPGTTWFYRLTVSDITGNVSAYSETVSATAAADTEAPQIISISPADGSTLGSGYRTVSVLAWDNHLLASMTIEYSTDGETYESLLTESDLNTYSVTRSAVVPLSALDGFAKIYVRAYVADRSGNTSETATASYSVDRIAPSVSSVTAEWTDGAVQLRWNGGGENDLTGYRIYRRAADEIDGYCLIGQRAAVENQTAYSLIDQSVSLQPISYVYKIEAVDLYGNTSFAETDPITLPDRSTPIPVLHCDSVMEVGTNYLFDASMSSDDAEIVSYHLDFGDGFESDQPVAIHAYGEIGSYTVTLTVTDEAENTSNLQKTITVKEPAVLATLNVRVVDENGTPVPNASVYFDLGSPDQFIRKTDGNGMASFTAEPGVHAVGSIIADNEWLPVKKDVLLAPDTEVLVTLTMVHYPLVEGSFEIHRMTFEEIVDAGIDINDPANQYRVTVNVHLKYREVDYTYNEPQTINPYWPVNPLTPMILGDVIVYPVIICPVDSNGPGGEDPPTPPVHPQDDGDSIERFALAYIVIPVRVATLKEFFNVELHIVNNAGSEFSMLDNLISLNLPDGMTIMETAKSASSAVVRIPEIPGQTSETIRWILRGDEVGDYYLSADYTGILSAFNIPITTRFEATDPIKVYGLSNMKLTVTVPRFLDDGQLYYYTTFANQGDIDVYCPSMETDDTLLEMRIYNNRKEDITDLLETDSEIRQKLGIGFGGSEEIRILPPGYRIVKYYFHLVKESMTVDRMELEESYYEFAERSYGLQVEIVVGRWTRPGPTRYTVYSNQKEFDKRFFVFQPDEEIEDLVLTTSSSCYNPRLAHFLSVMSRAAYNRKLTEENYGELGFDEYRFYHYGNSDYIAGYSIAKRSLDDGSMLVMITIRGSNSHQFVTTDVNVFDAWLLGYGVHSGFKDSAEAIFSSLRESFSLSIPTQNVKYLITGHSLGGAAGNLLTVKLLTIGVNESDIYNYNFACPNVALYLNDPETWNPGATYSNIINICNWCDVVASVPGKLTQAVSIGTGALLTIYSWGKFGITYWFNTGFQFMVQAHDMEVYVDYCAYEYDTSHFVLAQNKTKAICGRCPIDIVVYDHTGNPIAGVVNGEKLYYDANEGERALIFVNGDKKLIYLRDNAIYDVHITATDNGTMQFGVEDSGEAAGVKRFDSVELTDQKEYLAQTGDSITAFDTRLLVLDENGTPIAEIHEDGTETPLVQTLEGTVEWNAEDVKFKGSTPYVIANGSAQTPRFTVKNAEDGSVIDPVNYDYEYRENTNAGTGYVIVTFKGDYSGTAQGWFKIYLPATEHTYVENVSNGIKLKWDPVEGAAGYVIYRRAWSSTTNGWTTFERWNNTTGTTYIDGADANHKVYAGSRYQYGVKAYFARRTDPVSGATIGGNVGDNFNLGEVGPLKTTVRITTRKLVQVRPGSKQMTVKWEASKNFTGYQIKYATDANFTKNVKAIKIGDPTTYWTTIKELQSNTTYYVCIRSYHEFGGMTYFGEWSNVLSCKVK